MSEYISAAGELMDAGLAASVFESPAPGHGKATHCANCRAPLVGAFCHACGQSGSIHRSVPHLFEELLHGILHFDGKIWRTVPLLFLRPGSLTYRYVHGQRVRFVSPVGLFLFSIFLMFFTISTWSSAPKSSLNRLADLNSDLSEAVQDLKDAETDLADARTQQDQESIAAAEKAQEKAKAALEAAQARISHAKSEAAPEKKKDEADEIEPTWQNQLREYVDSPKFNSNFSFIKSPEMISHLRKSLRSPELLIYKIKGAASEFSFLLVPMSLPLFWVMFLFRRNVRTFDHVIFSLHSLSFMALFVSFWLAAESAHVPGVYLGWALLVPPFHVFVHLKGAYHLGFWGAVWRTWFLLIMALMVFISFVLMVVLIGLLD
jgi:protein required for attachment to host cells